MTVRVLLPPILSFPQNRDGFQKWDWCPFWMCLLFLKELQNKHRYHYYAREKINCNAWWNIIILGTVYHNRSMVIPVLQRNDTFISLLHVFLALPESIPRRRKWRSISGLHIPSTAPSRRHLSSTELWQVGSLGRQWQTARGSGHTERIKGLNVHVHPSNEVHAERCVELLASTLQQQRRDSELEHPFLTRQLQTFIAATFSGPLLPSPDMEG